MLNTSLTQTNPLCQVVDILVSGNPRFHFVQWAMSHQLQPSSFTNKPLLVIHRNGKLTGSMNKQAIYQLGDRGGLRTRQEA